MNFLQLMLGDKLGEGSNLSIRVGMMVGRAINGVFSKVEVTRKDGVDGMVVGSERIEFSKPKLTVRAMKVDVDKTVGFTYRPAGKIGLDGGALVDDHGRAVN